MRLFINCFERLPQIQALSPFCYCYKLNSWCPYKWWQRSVNLENWKNWNGLFFPWEVINWTNNRSLKLVSAFYFFNKWWPFRNYEKCLLFHRKRSFRTRDIQIFVFPSSPLFLPVGHCFRGWLNMKVINCLNENLITHFVWYLEKENRYDFETFSVDRIRNKKYFYGKIMQKIFTKN